MAAYKKSKAEVLHEARRIRTVARCAALRERLWCAQHRPLSYWKQGCIAYQLRLAEERLARYEERSTQYRLRAEQRAEDEVRRAAAEARRQVREAGRAARATRISARRPS